jgi:hypothetical protein
MPNLAQINQMARRGAQGGGAIGSQSSGIIPQDITVQLSISIPKGNASGQGGAQVVSFQSILTGNVAQNYLTAAVTQKLIVNAIATVGTPTIDGYIVFSKAPIAVTQTPNLSQVQASYASRLTIKQIVINPGETLTGSFIPVAANTTVAVVTDTAQLIVAAFSKLTF